MSLSEFIRDPSLCSHPSAFPGPSSSSLHRPSFQYTINPFVFEVSLLFVKSKHLPGLLIASWNQHMMGKVIKTILVLLEIYSHQPPMVPQNCQGSYYILPSQLTPSTTTGLFSLHIPKMLGHSLSISLSLLHTSAPPPTHTLTTFFLGRGSHFFLKEQKPRSYQMCAPSTPHEQLFPPFPPVSIAELSASYPRPISWPRLWSLVILFFLEHISPSLSSLCSSTSQFKHFHLCVSHTYVNCLNRVSFADSLSFASCR